MKIKDYFIVGLSIIIVILLFIKKPSHEDRLVYPDNSKDIITAFNKREAELKKEIVLDNERNNDVVNVLKMRIKDISKRKDVIKKDVMLRVDTIIIVKDYINIEDSIIVLQKGTIDTLVQSKEKMYSAFRNLILRKDEKYNYQSQITAIRTKENKRIKRIAKVEAAVICVLGGIVIMK